jgi:hypothetical protein
MFRKRVKKIFPPGTFISTPARVLAILQLCLAFSIIGWIASGPFMGDLFTYKSKLLVYQQAMGDITLLQKLDQKQADLLRPEFERNFARFQSLPEEVKAKIIASYKQIQQQIGSSFQEKLKGSFEALFIEQHPYALAWLLLSIIIPIFLLKRVEGALQLVWLLPLLALLYGYDNYRYGQTASPSPDSGLFPSEELIVSRYLKEPLSPSIQEQHAQLIKGWQRYLVEEWAGEEGTVEAGEQAFTLARLEKLSEQTEWRADPLRTRKPLAILFLYLMWNLYLAMKISQVLTCKLGLIKEKNR